MEQKILEGVGKMLIVLIFLLCSCQKYTYIVFKSFNYSDTIKLGVGLIVTHSETTIPEIALDTMYLRKYFKLHKP